MSCLSSHVASSAETHTPFWRDPPLFAIDPVAARDGTVLKRQPRWSRVCCRDAGCRQRNHINSAFIHHDLSADVNSIFTISAGRSATNVSQIGTSIRIILIMEYFHVSCRDRGGT